ncbi:PAS domain S-box-containing protein [Halorubrum alkaliphilum]|uniref:histidine kinase n=1 Tax=Halorubrum alkaliphilum TaxID=261290 RepID=A0A8T4GBS6_9EURY|nr:GAF domain-containing protein [Halorubrum alkaliphilum]MBP1921090.1 PAS domain S-box-containing protein [Halorubrum alkaliphilum]
MNSNPGTHGTGEDGVDEDAPDDGRAGETGPRIGVDGSDDAVGRTAGPDRVLVVDDEPGAADLAATYLDRILDDVETVTASSPDAAMDRIREGHVDCVVSDHDMPDATGLDLLDDVRAEIGDLPFILFTGKGSEEIASDAISAGVTDYLQKGGGSDGYEMLANRVDNALSRRHAEADLQAANRKVTAIHEFATEVSTVDAVETVFDRVVDVAERVLEFDRCVTARREGDHVSPAALSETVTSDEVRSFKLGEGIAGRTAAEERTFVIDELDRSDDADPVTDDIGSVISVPIGEYGVIQAVSSRPEAFDEADIEFAELVATHAAEAIAQIETESALRSERDRFAALFDNIPLPVARVLVDGDGNQRLDETNDAFEETFGYAASENGYQEARDAMTPDGARRVDPDMLNGDGDPIRVEVRRRTLDGVRDFILHGIPVSQPDGRIVYSVYADINDQKRVERTLRALHETTREMFQTDGTREVVEVAVRAAIDTLGLPNSGVRLYDPESGTLRPTVISEEATEIIGDRPPFGPGDGRVWEAFDRGELIRVDDLAAVDTTAEYSELRSLLIVPLGDHGVMPLGSRDPGFFDDRDVQLARVLGANVTAALDRAERTEQLRERDAELQRELDRHEKFAEMVSHDLRNPLTVASGRLELLDGFVDDDGIQAEIDRVEDAHDRIGELIDDLLALARHGRTVDDVERIDIATAAAEAWRTVDTESAVLETPDTDATIDADPERLRTLLENLFRNSVEHGSTSSRPKAEGAITVTVGALDQGFYIADDGRGFDGIDPSDALEHGVSGSDNGSGLGLAIVREIADAHGWETTVEDGSEGVRFEFRPAG